MRYEWDDQKETSNWHKHGVDFQMAIEAVEDPNVLIQLDRVDEYGEERFHAVGAATIGPAAEMILLVVHSYREADHGEEIIRIISARPAGNDDIRRYQAS